MVAFCRAMHRRVCVRKVGALVKGTGVKRPGQPNRAPFRDVGATAEIEKHRGASVSASKSKVWTVLSFEPVIGQLRPTRDMSYLHLYLPCWFALDMFVIWVGKDGSRKSQKWKATCKIRLARFPW